MPILSPYAVNGGLKDFKHLTILYYYIREFNYIVY